MSDLLTVDDFRSALPNSTRTLVTQELADKINTCIADPDAMENYRNNLLSYGAVMQTGKFKLTDYLNAVKYVTFKYMGLLNKDAFAATFPDKMNNYATRGFNEHQISSYVASYNATKLVSTIFEVAAIPVYVANADVFQKAIQVQADLMVTAKSDKVRSDAADSLMKHLKPPEVSKIELDVKVQENDSIRDLKDTLARLSGEQAKVIESGAATALEVAHSQVIPARVEHDS